MQHYSWDTTSDRCNFYFSFWASFCAFTTLTTHPPPPKKKKRILKWKQTPGDIIILHMCTKKKVTWCTVPEIWHVTDGWTDIQKWHTQVGAQPKNLSTQTIVTFVSKMCIFVHIKKILKTKYLHFSGVWNLPTDQILSLLVFNNSNYILFLQKQINLAYSLMFLSKVLDQ